MGKLNLNDMKAKLENESRGNFNTEYDKLQQGKNIRRLLWPKGDKNSFYSEGLLHFGLGAEGKSVVTCPKTFGHKERCPICEYVEKLQKSKNADDKKLASDIKARRRIYVNVINRDGEDDTPKVLPIGATIMKGLLETICDPDYGDITDYEAGRDFTITKKGQGLNTEYSVLPKPNSSKASETKTAEELEESMADLDTLFVKKSYDDIASIMNGEDQDEDEEEEKALSPNKDKLSSNESAEYDDMELVDLVDLCIERHIDVPKGAKRLQLITLLTRDDNVRSQAEEQLGSSEEEEDTVQAAIAAALERRKAK